MTAKKICFVIAPIGDESSDTRRRSEMVFQNVIKPAARKCGYSAVRSRDIPQAELITTDIIRHIVSDPLVIADLTDGNPNVFYELALRHAVRKPVVQIVVRGQKIPFNVMDMRTISYDIDDVDSGQRAVEEMTRQIRDIESNASPLETPLSLAGVDIRTLLPEVERTTPTEEMLSPFVKHKNIELEEYLETLKAAEATPLQVKNLIKNLIASPRVHLLENTSDDLDAACTLINNVPEGGYISATSSLQGDVDSDERTSYRTAVNLALERHVTYRKIICSSSMLSSGRHVTWREEFTEKARLIRKGIIGPDVFRLLHYPSPMSVDVLISQNADGECLEMVAGFAGGEGHGGFCSNDRRMVADWLDIYLEKKIIPEAEHHTKDVLDGTMRCSCLEFLKQLEDARQAAPQPKPVLRNTSPKRKEKSRIR